MANDYTDITKTGPKVLKGIRNPDLYVVPDNPVDSSLSDEDRQALQDMFARSSYAKYNAMHGKISSSSGDAGLVEPQRREDLDFGNSRFDKGVLTAPSQRDVQNLRAENEPWYAKVAAGTAKGAITAGTTFIDGTLGLICGFGTVAQNYNEGKRVGEAWSGLWNNEITQTMQKVTDWSEENLPNYYSTEEQETPWYTPSNIFTANFLGDKLIKQAGFMIGAAWAGKVWAAPAALLGQRLAEAISGISSTVRGVTNAPVVTSQLIGSVFSAVNEGSIEALNNSRDWANLQKQQIEDKCREEAQRLYQEYMENAGQHFIQSPEGGMVDAAMLKYEQEMRKLESTYNETVSQIEKDAALMGNKDLLLNIPILTIGNWVQFGKLFAGKYGQNKALSVVKDEATGKFIPTMTRGKALGIATKDATAEGLEELTQNMASNVSGLYYENDVNNFYRKQFDPEAVDNVMDWWDATAKGICETLGDANAWEEFTIGAIMGAFGVPSLRSMRTESGGWQSPFRMKSGAFASYREAMETLGLQQRDADVMNKAMEDPNFMTALQNIIREKGFENAMAQALKKRRKHIESANFEDEDNEAGEDEPFSLGDKFDYKNAEFGQLVSAVLAFERTGNLDALREIINNSYDTSDAENYNSLIKNTTREEERDGKKEFIGPFVDSEGNPLSKEEVDKQVETVKDAINIAIDDIIDIKNEIDAASGRSITGDQLDELVWLRAQVHDWNRRSSEMAGELKSVFDLARQQLSATKSLRESEGNKEQVKIINSWMQTLDLFMAFPPQMVGALLYSSTKEQRDQLLDIIKEIDKEKLSPIEKEKARQNLQDLYRAAGLSEKYNNTFEKYFNNPDLHRADHERIRQEAQDNYDKTAVDDFYNKLSQAKSVQEVDEILESSEGVPTDVVERALDKFRKSSSIVAKNWKEQSTYREDLQAAINDSEESDQAKSDAATLFNHFAKDLQSADEVSNSASEVLNSPAAFIEALGVNPDELSPEEIDALQQRWYDARYALTEAMNKVNRANNKKNGLRKPVPSPHKKLYNRGTLFTRKGKIIEVKKLSDETSDDGTRTVVFGESENDGEVQESKEAGIKLHPDEVDWEESYHMDEKNISKDVKNSQKAHKITVTPDGVHAETPDGRTLTLTSNPLDALDRLESSITEDYQSPGDHADKVPTPVVIQTEGTQIGAISTEDEPAYGAGEETTENGTPIKNDMQDEANQSQDMEYFGDSDTGKTDEDGNVREFYVTAISFFLPEQARLGNFALFPEIVSKGDYKLVFNYLVSKGAFKYVEDGKLKRGAGISFMIDPAHEEEKAKSENLKNSDPTIFMVETSTGQVVGVLDASERAERIYEGLQDLRASIIQQYNEWKKEQDKKSKGEKETEFRAKETTSVNSIEYGRIPYGDDEINLGEKDSAGKPVIPNVLTEEDGETPKEPLLAVVAPASYDSGAGGLVTLNTGKKSGLSIRSPFHLSEKKGHLYLLVPTPTGKYAVVALRTKHLNREEFDLDNPENVKEGSLGANILSLINKMAAIGSGERNSTSEGQDELMGILKQLKNYLHLGNIEIEYENEGEHGRRLTFKRKTGNTIERTTLSGTTTQVAEKEFAEPVHLTDNGTEGGRAEAARNILKQLYAFNPAIQVSAKMLNGRSYDGKTSYNRWLIESNVLSTNLTREYGARMVGSWFTTNPVVNGKEIKTPAPYSNTVRQASSLTIPGFTAVYTKKGKKYYISDDGNTIRDKDGKIVTGLSATEIQLLKDIAEGDKKYGVYTEYPGLLMGNKFIIKRDGGVKAIFDRSSQTYDYRAKEIKKFEEKLARKKGTVIGRNLNTSQAVEVINENQKLVRKNKDGGNYTDEKGYRINDGKGNGEGKDEYVRVHSIIGSGRKQDLQSIDIEQLKTTIKDSIKGAVDARDSGKYSAVLDHLIQEYGLEDDKELVEQFEKLKKDFKNPKKGQLISQFYLTPAFTYIPQALERQAKKSGKNINSKHASARAIKAGNAIDTVVRHFFQMPKGERSKIKNPDSETLTNGENGTFNQLLKILSKIEEEMEQAGEKFHSNNIVVWHKFSNGNAVAGELDILVTDKNGNFKIYDIKTSMYSFKGKGNKFDNIYSSEQERTNRQQYALQLSAYKNLFESQYGIPVKEIKIIPFKLDYNDMDEISQITYEGMIDLTKDYVSPDGIPNEMPKPRTVTTIREEEDEDKDKEDKGDKKEKEDTVKDTLKHSSKLTNIAGYKWGEKSVFRFGPEIYLRTPSGNYVIFINIPSRDDGTQWEMKVVDQNGETVKKGFSSKDTEANVKKYLDKAYREFFDSGEALDIYENEGPEAFYKALEDRFGIVRESVPTEAPVETPTETGEEEIVVTESGDEGLPDYSDEDFDENAPGDEEGEYSTEHEDNGDSTTPANQPKFELYRNYDISIAEKLFEDLVNAGDESDVTRELAKKVFAVAKRLGLKIVFTNKLRPGVKGNYRNTNIVRLSYNFFNSNKSPKNGAEILLHEIIHSVTMYTLSDFMQKHLTPELKSAANSLKALYKELQETGKFNKLYGMNSVIDMVAELSNPVFRRALIEYKPSFWERVKEAILRIFSPGARKSSNVYRRLNSALDAILDNFNPEIYSSYIVTPEEIATGVGNVRGMSLNESSNFHSNDITYDSLPEAVRDALGERGISEEEFNSKPDAFKEAQLDCIGFL